MGTFGLLIRNECCVWGDVSCRRCIIRGEEESVVGGLARLGTPPYQHLKPWANPRGHIKRYLSGVNMSHGRLWNAPAV
jgi:hypothetical protein